MNKLIPYILPLFLLTACATLYDATVTTTEIVKAGMTDWAELSVAGKTTPAIDKKVIAAHRRYQQAAVIARDELIAYKASGDSAPYQKAFDLARVSMNALLDIILPLLQPAEQVKLQGKAGRATKL